MMVTEAMELVTTVMLSRSEVTNTNHGAHSPTKGAESNQREYLKVKVYIFCLIN